eukprot:636437_1
MSGRSLLSFRPISLSHCGPGPRYNSKKTIYPQDLRAASKTATTESHFAANVEKLLKNYRSKLIISPTRNRKNLPDSENPNPPTIRISKDVGTCAKLTEKDRQVCVPLCCSA